ncbi:MAG: 4'-phosphopantetheinyl transferase superfamily protein [Lachnospiraceae bacterium]|nr:4'-phosphopantetheinyl transferase superfamily protein [Lachnospiraceae bacterium]
MADIYMANIGLLKDDKNAREALDGVDEARRHDATRMADKDKRAQSLTAGLLLQHGAREHLGDAAPAGIYKVEKDEKGRPSFPDLPEVYFSLAHSGDMAICAISDAPVGVDIQQHRKLKADIAKRFFHPAEADHLARISGEEYDRDFYALWCLKESYVKYTGGGLAQGLDELDFTPVLEGGFAVFEFTEDNSRIRAEILEAPEGYSAAVIEGIIPEEGDA